MSLDLEPQELRSLLHRAADMVVALYETLSTRPVFPGKSPAEIRDLFTQSLPDEPTDLDQLLDRVADEVIPNSVLNGSPHFFGYVMSSGNHAALVGELI